MATAKVYYKKAMAGQLCLGDQIVTLADSNDQHSQIVSLETVHGADIVNGLVNLITNTDSEVKLLDQTSVVYLVTRIVR